MRTTLRALTFTLLAAAFASGCGGCGEDDNKSDACADIECTAGVCDPDTGECANAEDCAGDDGNCLDGFACDVDQCVEVTACTTNSNCADGRWCDDGTCQADPCADVTCERGVCQVGVGMCVNAGTCTTATGGEACLEGNLCVEGSCVSEEDFCESLACDRGVCSIDERACVNAENCAGDDTACVAGDYCAPNNTCRTNECENNTCARGVCEQASGDCVDAETCTASNDCLDGSVCLSGSCVAEAAACGTDGCEGNQNCAYDESTLAAACEENAADGCANALDCVDDRICNAGVCAAPAACMPDAFEPNDDVASATNIQELGEFGVVNGLSLCGGDVDVFSFDTDADPEGLGLLTVRIDLAPEDIGLGTVELELVGPSGASLATGTNVVNGAATGSVELSYMVDVGTGGVFNINVSDTGDVSTAGVRYALSADLVAADVAATCAAATPLDLNNPTVGAIELDAGTSLNSSCGDDTGTLADSMFSLTLTESAFVEIQVTPQAGLDVVASLRTNCAADDSQVTGSCVDRRASGLPEVVSAVLAPGTYFLLVEPYTADTGSVVITVNTEPVVCQPSDNSCVDPSTAEICNESGTGYDQVTCPDGCDAATGACLRPAGDVCMTAIAVPSTGYEGSINLGGMGSDYDPGSMSCVPQKQTYTTRTDGEDGVYVVTVPAGKVLTMEAVSSANDDLALYFTTDCANVANSCLTGTDEFGYTRTSSEFAYWKNETGADQTVYAFIDVGDIDFSVGQANVKIGISDPICEPDSRRCVLNRESQLCNRAGTAYDSTSACDNGCDVATGECVVTNDVCGGAAVLTSGIPTSGTLIGYVDDYEPGESDCGSISEFDSGNGAADAVFRVDTTADGQTVTVQVDPVGFDAIVWLSDSCVADELGACLNGSDGTDSDGASETLTFYAATAGTYYLTVQDGDSGGSVGTFDITATIEAAACTPGEVLGCDATASSVQYCDDQGQVQNQACAVTGCDVATGQCVDPDGDVCFDAISLSPSGGTLSARFDNNGTDVVDFPSGITDQCDFPSSSDTGGDEVFHSITLAAGDLLTVNFVDYSSSDYGQIYFQKDCGSATSCSGFVDDGSQNVQYFAQQSETIFVVVDAWTSFSSFDYDLTWSISQPGWICEPGSARCSDPNTVETCSADGLNFTTSYCPTGCSAGSCVNDPSMTDSCTTAPNVGTNVSLRVDLEDDHTATLDPNGAACDLDGSGPDAFFAVNAQVYDVITVKALSTSTLDDLAVYIFSDCADAAGTCLGGVDQDEDLTFQKQVLQAGTYLVGIDHDSGTIYGTDVGVEITVEPGCIPTDPPACNAAGTAIEFCVEGIVNEYPCAGGCTNAACNTPRGDACFDAIPLDKAVTSVDGNWANNINSVEPGENLSGNCLFNENADGADDIYSIDLAAGETLTASLTSAESDAMLYFLGDCANPTQSCLAHTTNRDFETPITYHASVAETVFVVVDRDDTSTTETYTLNYDVDATFSCGPNSSQCTDATTLVECNADGTVKRTTACANGCAAGGCIPGPEVDSCDTATDIGAGGVFTGNYDVVTDSMNFGGLCAGEEEDGPDMFFSATLAQNDILRVTAQAIGYEPPLVYFMSDCTGDIASCLGGANEDSAGQSINDAVTVEYQAVANETVIIAVDSEFSSADEPVQVAFEVFSPDCDPATHQQQCNPSGDGFLYCNDRGFETAYACGGNNLCDAATGRCVEPVGDVCLDPFDANPVAPATPRTLSGTFAGFTNDYDLGTGNACTGSRTVGNEPVYVVDLTAGQTLTASVVSTETTPEDVAIYATSDCSDIRDQCLIGADIEGATSTPEQFTYMATTDETIYLMVDSFYATAAGTFDLTVDVN